MPPIANNTNQTTFGDIRTQLNTVTRAFESALANTNAYIADVAVSAGEVSNSYLTSTYVANTAFQAALANTNAYISNISLTPGPAGANGATGPQGPSGASALTPATDSVTSGSYSPDASSVNQINAVGLTGDVTFGAPTNASDGQKILFRIRDDGTSRTITWNAIYREIENTLPTSTTVSKITYVGCIYNSADTKWDAIAVTTEV